MTPEGADFATSQEACLKEGLSALTRAVDDLGAHCVSVILVENGGSIRMVYHWPESSAQPAAQAAGGKEMLTALETVDRFIPAESPLGRFLNQTATPAARSFLLVRWPVQRLKVVITFGYASVEPARMQIPRETSQTLQLAALATWNSSEIRRLRRDLNVVNDRLGRRKVVERAKGMLQARHGWNEQQAYEHLRRLSRQRRKNMADTAQELLRVSGGP